MKPKRFVWIAVHPDFRKKIKSESSLNDMSMIKYTKFLASDDFNIPQSFNKFKKKKDYDDPFKI